MYGHASEDWKALTENYRSMSDGELLELAADFGDLTPVAQQALSDEMRLRKLGDPRSPDRSRLAPTEIAPAGAGDGEVEYTWKTPLCAADDPQHAWQIQEMLRRAKIDSWIEGPGTYASTSGSVHTSFSMGLGPVVVVAADQLDQARALMEQPIPKDIVEASQEPEADDYEPPKCPQCGAEDPTLESADPVNEWKCESCGAEWADKAPESLS